MHHCLSRAPTNLTCIPPLCFIAHSVAFLVPSNLIGSLLFSAPIVFARNSSIRPKISLDLFPSDTVSSWFIIGTATAKIARTHFLDCEQQRARFVNLGISAPIPISAGRFPFFRTVTNHCPPTIFFWFERPNLNLIRLAILGWHCTHATGFHAAVSIVESLEVWLHQRSTPTASCA